MSDVAPAITVLSTVVAFVHCRVDGDAFAHDAVVAKLRLLGAKTVARLTKEVTHVIFQKKLQPTAQERAVEDADLRAIYARLSQVEPRVYVVSPVWLSASESLGRHAPEAKYVVRKPADLIFLVSSPTGKGLSASKRRRKSVAAARPRDNVEVDIDDITFSSTQQINEIHVEPGPGPSSTWRDPLQEPDGRVSPTRPPWRQAQRPPAAQAPHAPLLQPRADQHQQRQGDAARHSVSFANPPPASRLALPAAKAQPQKAGPNYKQLPLRFVSFGKPITAAAATGLSAGPAPGLAVECPSAPALNPEAASAEAGPIPPPPLAEAQQPEQLLPSLSPLAPPRLQPLGRMQFEAEPPQQAPAQSAAAQLPGQQCAPQLGAAPVPAGLAATAAAGIAGEGVEAAGKPPPGLPPAPHTQGKRRAPAASPRAAVAATPGLTSPPSLPGTAMALRRRHPPAEAQDAAAVMAVLPASGVAGMSDSAAGGTTAAAPAAAGAQKPRRRTSSAEATPEAGHARQRTPAPLGTALLALRGAVAQPGITPAGTISVPRLKTGSALPSAVNTPSGSNATTPRGVAPLAAPYAPVWPVGFLAPLAGLQPTIAHDAQQLPGAAGDGEQSPALQQAAQHSSPAMFPGFGFAPNAGAGLSHTPGLGCSSACRAEMAAGSSAPLVQQAELAPGTATGHRTRSEQAPGARALQAVAAMGVLSPAAGLLVTHPAPALGEQSGKPAARRSARKAAVTPQQQGGTTALEDGGSPSRGLHLGRPPPSPYRQAGTPAVRRSARKAAATPGQQGATVAPAAIASPTEGLLGTRAAHAAKPPVHRSTRKAPPTPQQQHRAASPEADASPTASLLGPSAAFSPTGQTCTGSARHSARNAGATPQQQQGAAPPQAAASPHAGLVGMHPQPSPYEPAGKPSAHRSAKKAAAKPRHQAGGAELQLAGSLPAGLLGAAPSPSPCMLAAGSVLRRSARKAATADQRLLMPGPAVPGQEAADAYQDQASTQETVLPQSSELPPCSTRKRGLFAESAQAAAAAAAELPARCAISGRKRTHEDLESGATANPQDAAASGAANGAVADFGSPPASQRRDPSAGQQGTPITSPSYKTRFQRRRYSRLGVDIEPLPPGQAFVLLPDGTLQADGGPSHAKATGGDAGCNLAAAAGLSSSLAPLALPASLTKSRCRSLQSEFASARKPPLASAQRRGALQQGASAEVPGPVAQPGGPVPLLLPVLEEEAGSPSLAAGDSQDNMAARPCAGGPASSACRAAAAGQQPPVVMEEGEVAGVPGAGDGSAKQGAAPGRRKSALAQPGSLAAALRKPRPSSAAGRKAEHTDGVAAAPSAGPTAGVHEAVAGDRPAPPPARRRTRSTAGAAMFQQPGSTQRATRQVGKAGASPAVAASEGVHDAGTAPTQEAGTAAALAQPEGSLRFSARLSPRLAKAAVDSSAKAAAAPEASQSLGTRHAGAARPPAAKLPPPARCGPASAAERPAKRTKVAPAAAAVGPKQRTLDSLLVRRPAHSTALSGASMGGSIGTAGGPVPQTPMAITSTTAAAAAQRHPGTVANAGHSRADEAAPAGASPGPAPSVGRAPSASTSMAHSGRGREAASRAGGVVRWLSHTCVTPAVAAAVQACCKQLPGARLCPEGYEVGRVTHLVVGADRRTIKLLCGVAEGAHLLSPSWVTDSLAAGAWLPEDGYRVQLAVSSTADAVRQQLAQLPAGAREAAVPMPVVPAPARGLHSPGRGVAATPRPLMARPLAGHQLAVHSVMCGGPKLNEAQARRRELEMLVQALGGRVVPLRSAGIVVVGAGVARPRIASGPHVLREEWLLTLAETHVMPDARPFLVE